MSKQLVTSRTITAFHEAGHAVAGSVLGRGVAAVTIVANEAEDAAGLCSSTESDLLREQLHDGGKPFPGSVESEADFQSLAAWERVQARAAGRARRMMSAAVICSLAGPLALTRHWPQYPKERYWDDPQNAHDREAAMNILFWLTGDAESVARLHASAEAYTQDLSNGSRSGARSRMTANSLKS